MLHARTGSNPLDLNLHYIDGAEGALVYLNPADSSYIISEGSGGEIQELAPFTYEYREIPELQSDERKYLVYLYQDFYHVFIDTLPLIFKILRADPNAYFVFHSFGRGTGIRKFILDMLTELGVRYTWLDTPEKMDPNGKGLTDVPICKIRNFSYYTPEDRIFNPGLRYTLDEVLDAVNPVLEQSRGYRNKTLPYRKVYLSRGKVGKRANGVDLRIEDEGVLEEYFAGLGYEICYPEDFESFQEQVDFMSEVKVLVAPTGSGLINQCMMQSGGTVVELRCEMVFGSVDEGQDSRQLMSDYMNLAYMKEHTYMAVPNPSRSASEAIAGFEKLSIS